jgi:hypothetical protein
MTEKPFRRDPRVDFARPADETHQYVDDLSVSRIDDFAPGWDTRPACLSARPSGTPGRARRALGMELAQGGCCGPDGRH